MPKDLLLIVNKRSPSLFHRCSAVGGTRTSTLSIQNNSGSTAYVTVQYKIDSGSYQDHSSAEEADNLSISSGSTNTDLTVALSEGQTITWRYKSSDTSGSWTGLSYSAITESSPAVDCLSLIHI